MYLNRRLGRADGGMLYENTGLEETTAGWTSRTLRICEQVMTKEAGDDRKLIK